MPSLRPSSLIELQVDKKARLGLRQIATRLIHIVEV